MRRLVEMFGHREQVRWARRAVVVVCLSLSSTVSSGFAVASHELDRTLVAVGSADALARLRGYMTDGVGELPPSPLQGADAQRGFWTGRELVVVASSGGAAFDPVTGRWRRIAPPPRLIRGLLLQGSPTWTGSEIAVLYPGVGAAYDPERDRWRTIDGAGFVPQRVLATRKHLVAFTDDTPGRVMQGSLVSVQSGNGSHCPSHR